MSFSGALFDIKNQNQNTNTMTWNDQFLNLFRQCIDLYRGGNDDYQSYYQEDDLKFLCSIGYKPRELFDFVEDLVDGGTPTESTSLLVAAVRRDYFLIVQKGRLSQHEISTDDLPSPSEALEGIAYLPRIIAKARAKLKGELNPDLMFSCGGDRRFLKNNGDINPADFLRHVWASGDTDEHIIRFVKTSQTA